MPATFLHTWPSILLLSLILTSCYSNRTIGMFQETTKTNNIPTYEMDTSAQEYTIRVNDQLMYRLLTMQTDLLKVLPMQNSTTNANVCTVAADGTIEIPFIGEIYVAGKTIAQAEKIVEDSFKTLAADAYIKLVLHNKTFTIIGDIGSGQFPLYKEKMNIYQALAMSGDIHNAGDRKHIKIIRPREKDLPEILEFDIRAKTVVDSKYFYIYPNDIIYVSRSHSSFFKVPSYTGVLSLITSSISLLTTTLVFTTNVTSKK